MRTGRTALRNERNKNRPARHRVRLLARSKYFSTIHIFSEIRIGEPFKATRNEAMC